MRPKVGSADASSDPKISSIGAAMSVPRAATPKPRPLKRGRRLQERSRKISCGNPMTVCAPVTRSPRRSP